MIETVDWNGQVWRRYPNSDHLSARKYFQRSTPDGCETLHRAVWSDANGPIPKGMQVHHVDGDTSNNDLSNLEMLSPKEHHGKHYDDKEAQRLREMSARTRANLKPVEKTCAHCGDAFKSGAFDDRGKFCSAKCRDKAYNAEGRYKTAYNCVVCGTEFFARAKDKQEVCSRKCSYKRKASRK